MKRKVNKIVLFYLITLIVILGKHITANAQDIENVSKTSVDKKTEAEMKKIELRKEIVQYALQFEGNPYVWGGTSLTRGADCSGFTQSIFRDNGLKIPRTSRTQATGGRTISVNKVQQGDLIFYGRNGRINHVAIYIGKGKVISASSTRTGIRITNYKYRTPYKAVSYIK